MRRNLCTAGMVVLMLALAAPAAAIKYSLLEENHITPQALEQMLKADELLLIKVDDKGALQLITSAIAIDAPPEQVFAALTDFDHLAEFMPSTKEVKVVGEKDGATLVSFHILFKFSVFTQNVKYIMRNYVEPGRGYWWELESGDLGESFGSWEVIPIDGGKRSAAVYSVFSDIRPVGRIIKYFIETQPGMEIAINASTCVLVLKAVRDRVESGIYAKGAIAKPAESAAAPAEPAGTEPVGAGTEGE